MESKLNPDEKLAKVSEYLLDRPDRRVRINVLEVLAGTARSKFQAIPRGRDGNAPEKYCGFAASEEEALKDCLDKIKDVSSETLMGIFVRPRYPENI